MGDFHKETEAHRQSIIDKVNVFQSYLLASVHQHDQSKTEEPEAAIFEKYRPKLKGTTYGSDEYNGYLKKLNVALDHHYAANPHHPEHHEDGIDGMNLMEIIEMFFDWWAAGERHADGDIFKSIRHNKKRFGISGQLANIFHNTAIEIGQLNADMELDK